MRVRANFIPLEWVIHSCPPFARISFQSKLWYTISVTVRTGETGMKIAISPNYINVKITKNLHNRALQPWLSERQIVVVFRIEQRKHLLLNQFWLRLYVLYTSNVKSKCAKHHAVFHFFEEKKKLRKNPPNLRFVFFKKMTLFSKGLPKQCMYWSCMICWLFNWSLVHVGWFRC